MAGQKKDVWLKRRSAWAYALQEIARTQGKDSTMYEMLGSVAWGRFDGEAQPDELKDNVVFGTGFLQGVRYATMMAGTHFQVDGTNDLRNIHDRIRKQEAT